MAIFNSYVKLPEGSWCKEPNASEISLQVHARMLKDAWSDLVANFLCFLTIAGRFGRGLVQKENEPFGSRTARFRSIGPIFTSFSQECLSAGVFTKMRWGIYFTSSHLHILHLHICISYIFTAYTSTSYIFSLSLSLFLRSLSLSISPSSLSPFSLSFSFPPLPVSHIFSFLRRELVPTSHNTQTFRTAWWSGVNCDYHLFANSCKIVIFLLSHDVSQKIGTTCVDEGVCVKARVCKSARVKAHA